MLILGTHSGWLLCPFNMPSSFLFLSTSMLSDNTRPLDFIFSALALESAISPRTLVWCFCLLVVLEWYLETTIWVLGVKDFSAISKSLIPKSTARKDLRIEKDSKEYSLKGSR